MKIHGLCVVKNEADIIEECLRAAAKWCDWIYVLDNGSDDGTWEKVQELARELKPVVAFRQDDQPFTDSIRDNVLSHYKRRVWWGDWWCVLDADEFYLDDPRAFLHKVPRKFKAVWVLLYTYLFTEEDLAAYEAGSQDGKVPTSIQQQLRHYVVGEYTELRFFRYAWTLRHVPPGADLQPIYPERIRLKHYAYRSPEQIRRRLQTRHEPMLRGEFVHERRSAWAGRDVQSGPMDPKELPVWEERVALSAECHVDIDDSTYVEAPPWTPPVALRRALRRVATARLIRAANRTRDDG